MIPLLLLTAFMGARGLDADAIWYDEYWSLRLSGGTHQGPYSVPTTVEKVIESTHERNPPLYYVTLNLWGSVAGWLDKNVRALSMFYGLLAVAVAYRLARDLLSETAGFAAAFASGLSAFYIYYLHEARSYVMMPLLILCMMWAYWRLINGHRSGRTQLVFVLSLIAMFYTNYLTLFAAVAVAAYHLLFARKDRFWLQTTGLMLLSGVAFLPWAHVALRASKLDESPAGRLVSNLSLVETLRTIAYGFNNGVWPFVAVGFVGFAPLVARRSRETRALIYVVSMAILALVGALVFNRFYPYISQLRYLIGLMPFWVLLFAAGVHALRRYRGVVAVLLAVWTAAGLYNSFTPEFNASLFKNGNVFQLDLRLDLMTDTIASHLQTDDAIAFYSPEFPWAIAGTFDYYVFPLKLRYATIDSFPGKQADDEYYDQVQQFIHDADRMWLGIQKQGTNDYHLSEFERALTDDGFTRCEVGFDRPDMTLLLYSRSAKACAPSSDSVLNYDKGISLTGLDPLKVDGGMLRTLLVWSQAADVPRETYSVALHVLDRDGQLVAQKDYGLSAFGFDTYRADVDISTLPPGTYTVQAIVYNWQSGERVQGVDNATGARGDSLALGTFEVR